MKNSMNISLSPVLSDYELLDSGDFEKLERFGRYVTRRPEPQAIWHRSLTEEEWRRRADAAFLRDARSDERGVWRLKPQTPDRWTVGYDHAGMHLRMRMGLTSFKHVGIFPEQAANWNFIYDRCRALAGKGGRPRLLNLFAYTGGATLAARAAGAETTHVDSVRQVVTWARENMELSGLDGVRWIVEDAMKFARQPLRRDRARSSGLRARHGRREVDPRRTYRPDARLLRAAALARCGGLRGAQPLFDGTFGDAGPYGRAAGVRHAGRRAVRRALFRRPLLETAAAGNLLSFHPLIESDMSLFALFFGLMSGCFLSVLVGIVGSKRRIGFGWAFLASLLLTPLVGLLLALISDPLPVGTDRGLGCIGTLFGVLGLLFLVAFLFLLLAGGMLVAM